VAGFPAEYTPGQFYTIAVSHHGGSVVANFNCSVRDSAGNPAGTLAPGTNTEVYSAGTQEPLGVHFSARDQESGEFTWISPDPGVGTIKLYLAGLQGHYSGLNTLVRLTATQFGAGLAEGQPTGAAPALLLRNRLVRDRLVLEMNVPENGRPQLRILNQNGTRVAVVPVTGRSATQTVAWEPADARGRRLSPGSYFVVLETDSGRLIRKFLIVK
jgi:hypothetical protein